MKIESIAHILDMLDDIKSYLYDVAKNGTAKINPELRTPPDISFSLRGGIRLANQILYCNNGVWTVVHVKKFTLQEQCLLTKCERNDLLPNQVAFMTNDQHADFADLEDYFVILSNIEQLHWVDGGNVVISDEEFTYTYRVELG